jgi:hypothetical protein
LLSAIPTFAQTINGPGEFDTYTEDFENGEAQGWTPLAGTWGVAANDLVGTGGNWYNMSEGQAMISSIYTDASFENFTISADIYPVWGNKTGIIFNYQDEDNFYVLEHLAYAKTVYLRQKLAGTWDLGNYNDEPGGYGWLPDSTFWNTPGWETRIDTGVPSEWIETAEFYNKIILKNADGLTTVWFNDVEVLTDVSTPEFTKGMVGIFTHWCPVFVDNVKVESNAAATPVKHIINSNDVQVFPNPTRGKNFSVRIKGFGADALVNIYDNCGKLLYSRSSGGQELLTIPTTEFNATRGIYILKVTSGQKMYTGKLLVQN